MGKCYNSVVINAPVDEVWQTIRNFHDLSWASEVITKLVPQGKLAGDQIGAKRVLNDLFYETLLTLDDNERTFSYSIDDGPAPISKDLVRNYVGKVHIAPITENDTTFVEWQSTFESANDGPIVRFCDPIYQALLSALKQHFA